MSVNKTLDLVKKEDVKMVDFKFIDLPGLWQHFSVPSKELENNSFEDGYGFDGSSLRGWQPIHASDMIILPDPKTSIIDPFMKEKTLSLIGNIFDPITRQPYSRDPRFVAQKAEKYLASTKIADTAYFGPEAEFFIFDSISYDQKTNESFYHIDSDEGQWNTGRKDGHNLGYKPRYKEGYFPVSPTDSQNDIRTEMVMEMEKVGIHVECQHHEVATAGQAEIDMRFEPIVECGDKLMWFKYIVKNVAKRHGKTATFMPKPLFDDNGSGMHIHVSLWKGDTPLFAGDKYAGLSDMALYFIGGILKHANAVCAFTNPTTNSYRRLVPGFEAPTNLAYSSRNRSAGIRIPMYSASPKSKRIEFRTPDPSCNPYLAFAAILMAGIDGIQNKLSPGEPLDKNIYNLPPEEAKNIKHVPSSLEEALDELQKDHEFLLKGDVFTQDLIDRWISYKLENEILPMKQRPVPFEFNLYYDI